MKRYDWTSYGMMFNPTRGLYVMHTDVQSLEAERDRLRELIQLMDTLAAMSDDACDVVAEFVDDPSQENRELVDKTEQSYEGARKALDIARKALEGVSDDH